jgi:uncharacterized peroxidase-related enzyme
LPQLTLDSATDVQREQLVASEKQLGRLPNLYAALANGPAALEGYLALRNALSRGVLSARLREQLALLVASDNGCTYCVSAHSLRGGRMGLTEDELARTRRADDVDPRAAAVLRLAREVLAARGNVSDQTLADVRVAAVTDAEIAETVAHVALNVLSNYFNHVARPDLDFPEVS